MPSSALLYPRLLVIALLLGASACTAATSPMAPPTPSAARPTARQIRPGTPDHVNIVKARQLGREQAFAWQDWSEASFAKAKADGRLVLLHGAAEWCHWCHVMEETTYRDPAVGKLLRERFVAIRVDIDSRPDIEERYDEWGWPATIVLDADGHELGKFRGYMTATEMLSRLTNALSSPSEAELAYLPKEAPVPVTALSWVGTLAALRMDGYYDRKHGSWGMRQKAPIGENISFEWRRYERGGDKDARERALFSMKQQAALLDPVWGGIYQYSASDDWSKPHYEKLMTYQASNLTAYADGYRLTGDKVWLAHARNIERYLNTILSSPDGAFYTTQDADVGAHDPAQTFVDGDVFYRQDDAGRRKLGMPRIDTNVYAEENGLAIAALCSLYDATHDQAVLTRARLAADRIIKTHLSDAADVRHAAGDTRGVYYLADAAAFGFAVARLAEVSSDADLLQIARRIGARMLENFTDPDGNGLWAHTAEPAAQGVFSQRRKPYLGNVNAARLLAALARQGGGETDTLAARRALAGFALPSAIRQRGRMIGAFLLAADEVGNLDWGTGAP